MCLEMEEMEEMEESPPRYGNSTNTTIFIFGQLHLKRIQTNETRYGQNWIHTTWACPKRVACCRT